MYALPSPGRKCDPDAAAEHSDIENAARPPYHRTSLAALRGQPSLSPVLSMYIPPEIRANLDEIERRAGYLWKFLDVPGKQAAIAKLEEQMGAQNFWDSQKAAQKVISECNGYKNIVAPQIAFRRQIEDAKTLAELITESPDGTADAEVEELPEVAGTAFDFVEIGTDFWRNIHRKDRGEGGATAESGGRRSVIRSPVGVFNVRVLLGRVRAALAPRRAKGIHPPYVHPRRPEFRPDRRPRARTPGPRQRPRSHLLPPPGHRSLHRPGLGAHG